MQTERKAPDEIMHKVQHVIGRLTYKPGWKIQARLHEFWGDQVVIQLSAMVCDLDRPSMLEPSKRLYFSSQPLPIFAFDAPDERIAHLIESEIARFEMHEMTEWLKLDGRCVTEPHPELTIGKR